MHSHLVAHPPLHTTRASGTGSGVIRLAAAAKVNLNLRVLGRRNDGYHLLDSLIVFAGLADDISLCLSDTDSIAWHGMPLSDQDTQPNSLVQARDAFRAATGWQHPLAITISKTIPIAAGLGGGSGDAAAVLFGMMQLSGRDFSQAAAIKLGADVPVQLVQLRHIYSMGAAPCLWRMQGTGEMVTSLPFAKIGGVNLTQDLGVILVNPGVALATRAVFAEYAHNKQTQPSKPSALGNNDLEAAACHLAPSLADCLTHLRQFAASHNALACGMTGSGASCFVLFASQRHAKTALESADAAWVKQRWHWQGGVFDKPKYACYKTATL